jgi:hypothetical protein
LNTGQKVSVRVKKGGGGGYYVKLKGRKPRFSEKEEFIRVDENTKRSALEVVQELQA